MARQGAKLEARPHGPTVGAELHSVSSTHHSHRDVVNRLKRASGHVSNVISMIEQGRGCLEIAQQLHAVIKALESAKSVLIHDHIDQCIEQVTGPVSRVSRGPLDEFKEITKYL